MSTFVYTNADEILDHIEQVLTFLQRRQAQPRPAPTRVETEQILAVAHAASLERDEGRRCTFTIAFYPLFGTHWEFGERPRFEPSILNRLASALNPSATNVGLKRSESDGALVIASMGFGPPDGFSVTVMGPGVLVVRYGDTVVLLYRKGSKKLYEVVSPEVDDALRALSIPFARTQPEAVRAEMQPRVDRFLRTTARAMLALGHGGALVVLPGDAQQKDVESGGPHHTAKSQFMANASETHANQAMYTVADVEPLIPRVKEMLAGEGVDPWRIKTLEELIQPNRWIDQAARNVARLTATDGMTVIEDDLTIWGFGVFYGFERDRRQFDVVLVGPFEDPTASRVKFEALGGARHQTAAQVCNVYRTALVIVASQDGALSAMRWSDEANAVVVHRGLELLLHPFDDTSVPPAVARNSLQLTPE
ncbi:MAG: putative sensor domain DACNV-containing protein [Myxococcales bacterium]